MADSLLLLTYIDRWFLSRFFNAWKTQVIREVPADKLLVWQVKEGWAPLCKVGKFVRKCIILFQFLGVPVPDAPFPNVNDTPTMLWRIKITQRVIAGTWALIMAGLAGAVYYVL